MIPDQMLRALAAERLNSTEEALSNPLTSAISGALSTAAGAFIPIVPFFFLSGYSAVIISAVVSLLAHFAVGAAKSLVTVRSWWSSGFEMTLVGAVEGVVTYVIGLGLGRLGAVGKTTFSEGRGAPVAVKSSGSANFMRLPETAPVMPRAGTVQGRDFQIAASARTNEIDGL